MEKDDEVKGNGNSLDFGARVYDSRLGRWLSVDPIGREYPNHSPFIFAGASPIAFLDPDGQRIILFVEKTYEEQGGTVVEVYNGKEVIESIINEGLGGQFKANLVPLPSGLGFELELTPTGGDASKLTTKQEAFYNALTITIDDPDITILNVVENSADIDIGSYQLQTIDVGDMNKFNANGDESTGGTSQGYLIHEISEQAGAQKDGVDFDNIDEVWNSFDPYHKAAKVVENEVNGNERGKESPTNVSVTKTYQERNGSTTTETYSKGTTDMKVDKSTTP
jgi:RHS repeat-associated protein